MNIIGMPLRDLDDHEYFKIFFVSLIPLSINFALYATGLISEYVSFFLIGASLSVHLAYVKGINPSEFKFKAMFVLLIIGLLGGWFTTYLHKDPFGL